MKLRLKKGLAILLLALDQNYEVVLKKFGYTFTIYSYSH